MDTITWLDIVIRLLFACILGSGLAIEAKWYKTRKLLQSNTQMAITAAMFAMLIDLTTDQEAIAELILGVSIICASILWQKQLDFQNLNSVIKLWCAGSVGCLVGYGLFAPAYLGTLAIVISSWIFKLEESEFVPNIRSFEKELQPPDPDNKHSVDHSAFIDSQSMYYRCQFICSPTEEVKALALLVKLSREQELIPTGLKSQNIVDKNGISQVQIEIDFIIEKSNNDPLQLQQILSDLKSQIGGSTANWLYLSLASFKNQQEDKLNSPISIGNQDDYRHFITKN
ncbi:mgtC family protein [Chondrocystis sp. NIES-4102]|nr:mgtC family protein [Chondrocystis sp. NIES-4102]